VRRHDRAQREALTSVNLAGRQRLSRLGDLVAGRGIATRGFANTSTSARPIAASAPVRLGVRTSPDETDAIAGRDVGAAPADVLAGPRLTRKSGCDRRSPLRFLHRHDGVGAGRQRRTGRDFRGRLPRATVAADIGRVDPIEPVAARRRVDRLALCVSGRSRRTRHRRSRKRRPSDRRRDIARPPRGPRRPRAARARSARRPNVRVETFGALPRAKSWM